MSDTTHERWIKKFHTEEDDHPGACMECCFYVRLKSELGLDWGVCTNPKSSYDGRVHFEHDGCVHFKRVRN